MPRLPPMSAGDEIWLDEEQQRAWRAYILGTTLLLDRLDRDLRQRHGLSLPEYEVLVRLSESEDGSMRMALLADAMCHSRSRITHTVARLEKAGLVVRGTADEDRRGVTATLTGRGIDVLRQAAPLHVAGVREHLVAQACPADFAAVGRVFDAVCDDLMVDRSPVTDIRS